MSKTICGFEWNTIVSGSFTTNIQQGMLTLTAEGPFWECSLHFRGDCLASFIGASEENAIQNLFEGYILPMAQLVGPLKSQFQPMSPTS